MHHLQLNLTALRLALRIDVRVHPYVTVLFEKRVKYLVQWDVLFIFVQLHTRVIESNPQRRKPFRILSHFRGYNVHVEAVVDEHELNRLVQVFEILPYIRCEWTLTPVNNIRIGLLDRKLVRDKVTHRLETVCAVKYVIHLLDQALNDIDGRTLKA